MAGVNRGTPQQCVSISEAGFYQVVMLSRTEFGKKLMKLKRLSPQRRAFCLL